MKKGKLVSVAFIIGMLLISLSGLINLLDGDIEIVIFTVLTLFFIGVFFVLGYKIEFENLKWFSILSIFLGVFFIAIAKTPPNEELSTGGNIAIILTIILTLLGIIEVAKYKMHKR